MKCPLRVIAIPSNEAKGILIVYDCLKEDCAWWEQTISECSIRAIAGRLDSLDFHIIAIETKMPHEEQFRR